MNEEPASVGISAIVLGERYVSVYNEYSFCTGCDFAADEEDTRCKAARSYTEDSCRNINFVKVKPNDPSEIEVEATKPCIKPPLGLMPLRTHNALRLNTIVEALDRYAQAKIPAPKEWTTELTDLILFERKYNQEINKEAQTKAATI